MLAIVQLNDGTFHNMGALWAFSEAETLSQLIKLGAIKAVYVWQAYKQALYPYGAFTSNGFKAASEHEDFFGPRAYYNVA